MVCCVRWIFFTSVGLLGLLCSLDLFYFRYVVGLLCLLGLLCSFDLFLLPLGCWVVGLLCLLGLLCSLDLSYFRWAVGSVVFFGSVVFV